jgi:3-oxoadipate enol-lactonase
VIDAAAMISIGGQQTAVVDVGEGPPLVVLHSLALDWRIVRGLLPALAGHRVLAYDLRAHGASSAAPSSFSLEACADDLIELLDALAVGRACLAGFSLGGAIAQLAALRAPQRVRSLVLVCTMAQARRELYLERALAAERAGTTAVQVDATLRRWFTPEALAAGPAFVDYARDCVLRASVAQWSAWWRRFATFDIRAQLGAIGCPVTLIAGEHDRSTPPSDMEEMARSLPHARLHVLAGASHMAVLEQPERVGELVRGHLAIRP